MPFPSHGYSQLSGPALPPLALPLHLGALLAPSRYEWRGQSACFAPSPAHPTSMIQTGLARATSRAGQLAHGYRHPYIRRARVRRLVLDARRPPRLASPPRRSSPALCPDGTDTMAGGVKKPVNIFRLGNLGEPKGVFNWRLWFAVVSFGLLGAARGIDEGLISGTFNSLDFKETINYSSYSLVQQANIKANVSAMVQIGSVAGALL